MHVVNIINIDDCAGMWATGHIANDFLYRSDNAAGVRILAGDIEARPRAFIGCRFLIRSPWSGKTAIAIKSWPEI